MTNVTRHRPRHGRTIAAFWCVVAACVIGTPAPAADESARTLLRIAVAAQGGEAKLRGLRSVSWDAVGYRNMLEQSERPEGPYIVEHQKVSEVHDQAGGRYRSVTEMAVYPAYVATTGVLADRDAAAKLGGGTAQSPGDADLVRMARDTMALSPERLLLTALDAPDAHVEAGTVLQSVPQDVVAFSLQGAPVRIYLNRYTHLPTAVDYSGAGARTGYWRYLGDVTMRTAYSFWWIAKGGVRLPMQWDVTRNGLPDASYVISRLQVDAIADGTVMDIAPAVRKIALAAPSAPSLEDLPLGTPRQPPSEVAPGVTIIPGAWYVALVRQDDGIVIVEAPISSGYSAKVLAEAARRYPGVPVKAVISTSDSWPHIGGIREYVARDIPIYALDLNAPILKRLTSASRKVLPDALERRRRAATWRPVNGPVTIGRGRNKIVIYPTRGETSERQLMVYLPELALLYGSDTFQIQPDGSASSPQAVTEILEAAAREGLKPERFFMMHLGASPWASLANIAAAAGTRDTPDGRY